MILGEIKKYNQLDNVQKEEAVEVFLEGFGHMMTFAKNKQDLKDLFSAAFHPEYIYTYLENDIVLGILGIATNRIRPIKFDENQCVKILGKQKGYIVCKQMNMIFQSKVVRKETDLYIDVLATTKNARGRGVATKLLEYAFSLPRYEECYIEVLSKNRNAKRLYEKRGFVIHKRKYLSSIRFMGFGYPIKMKRKLT